MPDEKREFGTKQFLLDTLRVVPTQYKVKKDKNSDRLTDLLAVLLIIGIAVFVRFYVRDVFIEGYSDSVFDLVVNQEDTLGFGRYLGVEPGETIYLNGFGDFGYYYIDYVNAFLDGWNPYSGNIVEGDHIGGYVYGPLFIYSISVGKAWFGLSAYNSVVYSNIIFDSLSYVMVYLLAKRVTGNVIALLAAILGSFSPIALFYANIRGLNAPLMNFLALVFVYYFLERKDGRAIFFLAMATMTKQFPLFLALPVGFWMMRRYGILRGIGFILLYVFDILLLSVPWILKDPWAFVRRLFLPGGSKDIISCPSNGEATNLVHGVLSEICPAYNDQTIAVENVPSFANFLFPLVNYHILFFGFIFLFGWIALTGYDYFEDNPKLYLTFFAAFYTIVHATIARGIYKYYLTMIIPFIILAFIPGATGRSLNIRIGAMLNRLFNSWLRPKNRIQKPSMKYWLGMVYLLLSVVGIIWTIDASISLFTSTEEFHNLWLVICIPLALYFIIRPSPLDIEEDDTLSFREIGNKIPVLLSITIAGLYFLNKIAVIYFSKESSLDKNLIIMSIIIILFISLPFIEKIVFQEKSTFKFINLELNQLFWDVIGLTVAYFAINFFTIQVLIVSRFQITTVLLIMGIILMGMMEGNVWIATVKVPISVYKRLKGLKIIEVVNSIQKV